MIRQLFLALMLLMLGGSALMAQNVESAKQDKKEMKKAEKAAKKAAEEAQSAAQYELALKALEQQDFVLEATRVEFKRGKSEYVSANTNFVSMHKGKATVQLAMNGAIAGPNGMGGITVEGNASNIEMKTDKKGNVTYEFQVQGVGISARVSFRMTKGTNRCRATVLPNFNSNRISFDGDLLPSAQSKVFKGRTL